MELNLIPVSSSSISFSISTTNKTTPMKPSPQWIYYDWTNDASRWLNLSEFRSHRHESSNASRSSK